MTTTYLSLWGQDRRHDGGIPLERDLDYGDLRRAAARMANALAARGVLEGDRVALLLPNSVDFVVAALATCSRMAGSGFVRSALEDPQRPVAALDADSEPVVGHRRSQRGPQHPVPGPVDVSERT